jgi:hypothetical protein
MLMELQCCLLEEARNVVCWMLMELECCLLEEARNVVCWMLLDYCWSW